MPPARNAKGRLATLRVSAETLADRLPALLVQADRVANVISHGEHGRRQNGSGESFWQFRQHVQGDPTSTINWRQSAKSQNLYVRENEWEGAESVWFWCDRSLSMDYCSRFAQQSKLERALLLTLALAGLLIRGGERTGLLGAGMAPGSGRAALNRMSESLLLSAASATAYENLPLTRPLPRFSKLLLISDFLSPIEEVSQMIREFTAHGAQGHMLQVLDPAEEDLPFEGRVRFQGLEGEEPLTAARAQGLRAAYQRRLGQHRGALEALCHASGWSFASHSTSRAPHIALLALHRALSEGSGKGARQC